MSLKNPNPNEDEEGAMIIKLPSSDIRGTEAAEIVVADDDDNSSDDSILLPDNTARKHSALDAIITRIGMGKFQKQLLVR